jgi:hypothetical protein
VHSRRKTLSWRGAARTFPGSAEPQGLTMPRSLFDSEYIHGLHDPGGEGITEAAGRPGWVLFTLELGADPNNHGGFDFRPWSDRGLGIIGRLNHGYFPNGTIPASDRYADFARRCANFVAASAGCKIWVIGNEMNFAMERPRLPGAPTLGAPADREMPAPEPVPVPAPEPPELADPTGRGDPSRFSALHPPAAGGPRDLAAGGGADGFEVITPDLYARCYRLCRDAIRAVPGHGDDQVVVGAAAPWNNQTQYPGNLPGDWVKYMADILVKLGPGNCDAIAMHTYTHGTSPDLVDSDKRMDPPFQNRHYHFKAYQDFLNAVPANMRALPVYVTETDEDDPWADVNSGWVQRAYASVNTWNQAPGAQQIHALLLYRWPRIDRWYIDGKGGVIDDFRAAVQAGYRWRPSGDPGAGGPGGGPGGGTGGSGGPPASSWAPGSTLATLGRVNLRRSPGYRNKPPGDLITQVPVNGRVLLLPGGPKTVDDLPWWPVRWQPAGGPTSEGWMAEFGPNGSRLLVKVGDAPAFAVGDTVRNISGHNVNLRRSPGYRNKPAADVVAVVTPGADMTVTGGAQAADGLTWWPVRYAAPGHTYEGWIAQAGPGGEAFLAQVG